MTRDFHLDTLFNPIWTEGPHVFTFSESGTVIHPKNIASRSHASNAFRQPLRPSSPAARTYADAVKAPPFSLLSRMRKPWKNATMTEQDDAEFEALMTRSIAEASRSPQSSESASDSVYTWPPDLSACRREAQTETCRDKSENDAPSTPYMVSPSNSQTSETDSSVIPTPDKRGDRMPFMVLHETSPCFEEEELEKILVGVERLRRKAPPPLCLEGTMKYESDSTCVLLKEDATILISHPWVAQQVLSPLTAGIRHGYFYFFSPYVPQFLHEMLYDTAKVCRVV